MVTPRGVSPQAETNLIVTAATAADAADWDAFVRSRRDASGYHLWAWRHVFEQGLRRPCHYLTARQGDRITGVLPLVELRSWMFGRALSSLPYANYGGVLAADSDAAGALVTAAGELAADRSLSYVLLRHRKRQFPALPARSHKVSLFLTLPEDEATLWDGLDRKVRNQIRKAAKSGIVTATGGMELLDEFYAVFARNMRDLGTPVYGRRLFAAILEHLPRDARLHVARLKGQPIAGALSYGFGSTIEVPSASSLREHRSLCPNYLVYWSILRDAIADRRTMFDFGRSTPGDGTYQFKTQWGATPQPLWWEYHLQRGDTPPGLDRQNDRMRTALEMWKRLPVGATRRLGPLLSHSVP
jgi:FemAB-related protein (PEP-CTERM system-associated)